MLQFFTFIFSQHRYRHINTTDSLMFNLAPILPMSDVRISLTLMLRWQLIQMWD